MLCNSYSDKDTRRVQVFASHTTRNSFRHSWDLASRSIYHCRVDGAQSPQEGSDIVLTPEHLGNAQALLLVPLN